MAEFILIVRSSEVWNFVVKTMFSGFSCIFKYFSNKNVRKSGYHGIWKTTQHLKSRFFNAFTGFCAKKAMNFNLFKHFSYKT